MGEVGERSVYSCEPFFRFFFAFEILAWIFKRGSIQMFGVPPGARRSKPFIDHILSFSTLDGKIWFRNFQVRSCPYFHTHPKVSSTLKGFSQIVEKDPLQPNGPPQMTLVEIGPRFVLTPIRIFEGAFSGATVYSNPGALLLNTCPFFNRRNNTKSYYFNRIRLTCNGPIRIPSCKGREIQDSQRCRSRESRSQRGQET